MEEEHHGKNTSGLLENTKHVKERSKREGINDSRKSRSALERKHSERYKKVAHLIICCFLDSVHVHIYSVHIIIVVLAFDNS